MTFNFPLISRQAVLPRSHPAPVPATARRLGALGEIMDQLSEKEHAEEVNSERGPFREVQWVR